MAKIRLNILLVKENIPKEKVLKEGLQDITLEDGQKLYYSQCPVKTPKWVNGFFVGEQVVVDAFKVQGTSAVMMFERTYQTGSRIFVVTFGYGRALLRPDVIEERFGLITALSSIDKDKIRSLDTSSLDAVLLNSRRQASVLSNVDNFALNVNRDLLKSVTGRVEDEELSTTLTGKDSLTISTNKTYKTICEEIDKYYAIYKSDKYKNAFIWVDQIRSVKDTSLIQTLNSSVVQKINNNQLDNIWISFPELIDWKLLSYFKFGRNNHLEDVDIKTIHDNYFKKQDDSISIETLKNGHIKAYDSSDQLLGHWSIYNSLFVDCQYGGKQFFLHEGSWYQIENNFVKRIEDFYQSVPIFSENLHDYDVPLEDTYNKKLVSSDPNKYYLMDKKLTSVGGSTIEVCDVLTKNHHLLHVKKYTGSAVLSHLFNQGLVSAQSLKDPSTRKKINTKISKQVFKLKEDDTFNVSDFEVVFVIARKGANANQRPTIPFFSKVSLESVCRTLQLIGYKYSIAGIPFTYVDKNNTKNKKAAKKKATSKKQNP